MITCAVGTEEQAFHLDQKGLSLVAINHGPGWVALSFKKADAAPSHLPRRT
jgi:hypothetical protein